MPYRRVSGRIESLAPIVMQDLKCIFADMIEQDRLSMSRDEKNARMAVLMAPTDLTGSCLFGVDESHLKHLRQNGIRQHELIPLLGTTPCCARGPESIFPALCAVRYSRKNLVPI